MLKQTRGIVLRSVKYGETSLICSIFTEHFGVQSYLIQGVRTTKQRQHKAGLLQPASLLDLIAYQKAQKNIQRLKEFQAAYIYISLQQEIVKNSITLFSVELLLRLLPEHAPQTELFDFAFQYFVALDQLPTAETANFPLWFIIQCSRLMGYELQGNYTTQTPHLNLQDGGFSGNHPQLKPYVSDQDAQALSALIAIKDVRELKQVVLNAAIRYRLLEWYVEFLHRHSDHLSPIKSLAILQAVMH